MNVLSLFAGCGGSSLGWKMAGQSVVAACEFDQNAVDTYRINFPKTQMFAKSVKAFQQILDLQDRLKINGRELGIRSHRR